MKKYKFITLFFITIILVGCGTQKYEISINDKGNITYNVSFSLNDSTLDTLSQYGYISSSDTSELDKLIETEAKPYTDLGFDFNIITNPSYIIELSKTYQSIDELIKDNDQLIKAGVSGIKIDSSSKVTNGEIAIDGKLKFILGPKLYTALQDKSSGVKEDDIVNYIKNVSPGEAIVTVYSGNKGEIKYSEDGISNDNSVSWTINYKDKTKEFHVQQSIQSAEQGFFKIIFVIGGIAVIIVIIVVLFKNKKFRKFILKDNA